MGAMMLSKYTDHGTFSLIDRVGTAIALAGVLLVTQPDSIFRPHEALPLGPKPDTFAKIKGLACGTVGVLGTVVSSDALFPFNPDIREYVTDSPWLSVDCFDNDTSHRLSSSSSYCRQLLRMGDRAGCHGTGYHRAPTVATDYEILVFVEHCRRGWRIDGTCSSS